MVLPVLLLFLAALASAIVAYGTHPAWADFSHGLGLILFTRRFEWPLAAVAILLCLAVVGLVVAGKRRAWWLIGLGPILALFVHRYATDPFRRFAIVEAPKFVAASDAGFLSPSDYVVGLAFEGTSYAYPYAALYSAPVVFQAEHDKRMMLMWNAFANRALAYRISHELYARDMEIVSMPGNAMLLYNSKLGQFINGITGYTPDGDRPKGFGAAIPVQKTTWADWLEQHPICQVMAPAGGAKIPNSPLRPIRKEPASETLVAVIATTQPVAVAMEGISEKPASVTLGGTPVLVFRETPGGRVRVFDRRVEDLTLKFKVNRDAKRKGAVLVDQETESGWAADGRAVDGPGGKEGKRLVSIAVDEGLYWSVMKRWMPQLTLMAEIPVPPEQRPVPPIPPPRSPRTRTRGR